MSVVVAGRRRNGNRKKPLIATGHVDHIISIQGADTEVSSKLNAFPSPGIEHVKGIIHSTTDGIKSNMKMNLPIITDKINEEMENIYESDSKKVPQKNGYQPVNINSSREIIDLSPIYENSSDACSSHDDLKSSTNDFDVHKSCKMLNDSSSITPQSLSHSDNSFELSGTAADSLRNSKRKKRVNIAHEVSVGTQSVADEITAFQVTSESSLECSTTDTKDVHLTMTGTIKRGKKKGQNVNVKLNISREELEIIEAAIVTEAYTKMDISECSAGRGPHVLLFTLLTMPAVAFVSALYSFYIGTITWYSIFTYITEEASVWKRIVFSPLVILVYPFAITLSTLGLGLYAGVVQLTFSATAWYKEVSDFEKGFYGWLCSCLGISECSPYEVVILTDVKDAA